MRPEEIRKMGKEIFDCCNDIPTGKGYQLLAELAAQVAEMNDNLTQFVDTCTTGGVIDVRVRQ